MKLDRMKSAMEKKFSEDRAPPYSRIDTVCVLEKGVICNVYPNEQIDALPGCRSQLRCIPTTRALLLFYSLVGVHLFKAQIPFFDLHEYLLKVPFKWPDLKSTQA